MILNHEKWHKSLDCLFVWSFNLSGVNWSWYVFSAVCLVSLSGQTESPCHGCCRCRCCHHCCCVQHQTPQPQPQPQSLAMPRCCTAPLYLNWSHKKPFFAGDRLQLWRNCLQNKSPPKEMVFPLIVSDERTLTHSKSWKTTLKLSKLIWTIERWSFFNFGLDCRVANSELKILWTQVFSSNGESASVTFSSARTRLCDSPQWILGCHWKMEMQIEFSNEFKWANQSSPQNSDSHFVKWVQFRRV